VRHPRVVHKAEEVRAAPPNKSFDTDAQVLQRFAHAPPDRRSS
jgi:hypothetical protein